MTRELTVQEIAEFSCRDGCKKNAVEYFLRNITKYNTEISAITSARMTAKDMGWNRETADSIVAGIKLAFKG